MEGRGESSEICGIAHDERLFFRGQACLTESVQTTRGFETVRDWSLLAMASGVLRGELIAHKAHMQG